ncbi:hypothetical protein GE061_018483 [Apolygus lucorum]|uniref:Uncharacterized protein n=1 Tax=Apolygus lucorum TaxID=248454 RepID=A0A8S9XE15_APOLU|nr:hypothetical protein GE061_018483 [Apolygus lucorum]
MSGSSGGLQRKKRRKEELETSDSDSAQSPPDKKVVYNMTTTPTPIKEGVLSTYDQLYEQLMKGFRGLMQEQTESFKQGLQRVESSVALLSSENKTLNERCEKLSEENANLREYVELLDVRQRRGNLVLNGIVADPSKNLKNEVVSLLRDVMKVEQINFSGLAVSPMGGGLKPPILLEFGSPVDVHVVLKNTVNLKGTNFYISRDMPPTQRANRNKMLRLRHEIKKLCPNISTLRIIQDKILINNKLFRWSGSKLVTGENENGISILKEITGTDFSGIVKAIQDFRPPPRNSPRPS